MKKLVTLASVGMFLLSLLGVSLAQGQAPVPVPAAPPVTAAPAAARGGVSGGPERRGERGQEGQKV